MSYNTTCKTCDQKHSSCQHSLPCDIYPKINENKLQNTDKQSLRDRECGYGTGYVIVAMVLANFVPAKLIVRPLSNYFSELRPVASPAMGHWGTCPPPQI